MSEIAIGSYVLGTKFHDGDPGDPWAVGYYMGRGKDSYKNRHLIGDKDGNLYYGPKGFIRIRANLKTDVGHWLVENCSILEKSPPGSINLWNMLTEHAFETEATTGGNT